ncbi:CLUMA_CG018971, isoform A [Clunio marinus]|uniref:CLUMA_CG018971, isoform A n=1 Tax=Clunio marinus TaxID=568069 RepID=A0A1J1J0J7_9DIPT|nr:CLUMA_CG018971, isoform A [Clunio marinus]
MVKHLRHNVILTLALKQVIKNISGEFKSCELTAIMGTSGSGKTTLLNILSGFVTENVTGVLEFNRASRSQSYIMQDENLNLLLSVNESMMFSINLKCGSKLTREKKKQKVDQILETLGLEQRTDVFVKNLSGGQRKRLSIAIELVDDPSILFLDEPTTGLDSSSSLQCIRLLKKLSQQGKTIICTIHTPSALLFQMFDHLYAMTDGRCIYQGGTNNLVPFLADAGLNCPPSYNPSDFLMEIATGEYGSQNDALSKMIQNGSNESYRVEANNKVKKYEFEIINEDFTNRFSSSFMNQLSNLLLRNFLMLYRDKVIMWLRLGIHIVVALIVGAFFENTGGQATRITNNFRLVYAITLFLMYTSFYSLATRFSSEIAIIKTEHFNRWYSTSAYYLAMTIADIPLTLVCSFIFVATVYVMTDQPFEDFRFAYFVMLQILSSFISQGLGLMIGSFFKLMNALYFAAVFLPVIVLFGGFMITQKDANKFFYWIFEICYTKHAGDATLVSILGYNRSKLECTEEIYCHFERPQKFLEEIDFKDEISVGNISVLIASLIIFRLVAFYMINHRLKH